MKINNRTELQNIAINNSADIDYDSKKKICEDLQKKKRANRILLWQPILCYQPMILQDLEKICFLFLKMRVTDQLKISGKKIKTNQAYHDLD